MMTKTELIKIIAEEENFNAKDVARIINKAAALVIQKVAEGDAVRFKTFGTFFASNRAERVGKNPRTGEQITIKAHKIPYFRAGQEFKRTVNQ